jgi:serine/threonine protein kinase/WD40 repeat protein
MLDTSVLLGQLAEEFTARVRAGEMPAVEDYAARHPAVAERIRALFPTLLLLEGLANGTPAAAPVELTAGSTFGAYRIEREIGRGGMGVVYEAVHLTLNRRVALKVLPVQGAHAARQLERFLREAQTAASLHHTNIVPVFDVGQQGGTPYYAMQLVHGHGLDRLNRSPSQTPPASREGEPEADDPDRTTDEVGTLPRRDTLSSAAPARAPLSFAQIADIGIQAAEALAYAHQRGVIHRDIKPSNLLLDEQGVVWITDFGLARRFEDVRLTHSGTLLGTPRYMSPEQAEAARKPVDHRTDIYSLGATLYELITRRPAFDGNTPHEVVLQILDREPVPPRRLDSHVPRDLETVVMKAMAKRPEDRYQSAQDLADDLRRFRDNEPIHARRISIAGRFARWCRRNPTLAGVSAASLLLLVLLTTFYVASLLGALAREQAARGVAEQKSEESRQRLVRFHVSNGNRLVEEGDLLGSLPWFAEALRLEEDDPERAALHQMRLESVMRHSPRLSQVWFHDGPVTRVAFSPDGNLVATASLDHTVRIWNSHTGSPAAPVLRQNDEVRHVEFNAPGTRLLTITGGESWQWFARREARLWDVATWQPVGSALAFKGYASQVRFSPDGKLLVLTREPNNAETERGLAAHDASTGALRWSLTVQRNLVWTWQWAPDSRRLFFAEGQNLQILDAATGGRVGDSLLLDDSVSSLAVSPDGRFFAASTGATVRVWNAATRQPVGKVLRSDQGAHNLLFSPDGRKLVFTNLSQKLLLSCPAEHDRTMVLHHLGPSWLHWGFTSDSREFFLVTTEGVCHRWETDTGRPIAGSDARRLLTSVSNDSWPSPNGLHLLVHAGGQDVRLWNMLEAKPVGPPLKHDSSVAHVAFSPDASRLVTASQDGRARLWDLAAGPTHLPALAERASLFSTSLGSDGSTVVGVGRRYCAFWDHEGRRLASFREEPGWSDGFSFSPDGRSILHKHKQGSATLVSVRLPHFLKVAHTDFSDGQPVTGFSADGLRLLTLNSHESARDKVRIWDVTTGEIVRPLLDQVEDAQYAWISPDGMRVVTIERSGDEYCLRLYDVGSGKLVAALFRGKSTPYPVRFHPSRSWFLTARSQDDPLHLHIFDAKSGVALREPLEIAGPCDDVLFSPANDQMVLVGKETRVWNCDTWEPGPALRHHAGVETRVRTAGVFNPDGTAFAGPCEDGTRVCIWDMRTGEPRTPLLPLGEPVGGLQFSREGRLILTTGTALSRVWDARSGEAVTPPFPCTFSAGLTPAGDAVLTQAKEGPARRWELRPEGRSAEEWLRLARVLACRKIAAGGHVLVDRDTYRVDWETLPQHGRTTDRAPTAEQRRAWHWQVSRDCADSRMWAGQLLHLDRVLAEEPGAAYLHHERGQADAILLRWQDAAADFTRALGLGSDDLETVRQRAHARAMLRQWRDAAQDLEKVVREEPDELDGLREWAALLLLAGDSSAYRALCRKVMASESLERRYGKTSVAWVCLLGRNAVEDSAELLRLLEKELENRTSDEFVKLRILGAACLRAGRAADALVPLGKAAEGSSDSDRALAHYLLALASHMTNRPEDATKARDAAEQFRSAVSLHAINLRDWLELEVLSAEVERTLGKR